MKLKRCVKLLGVKQELLIGLMVADYVWIMHAQELVVTSLVDGEHVRGSLHYKGYAADLRTRYFINEEKKSEVAEHLRQELGPDFDVVLEDDHIHMEYDPKG